MEKLKNGIFGMYLQNTKLKNGYSPFSVYLMGMNLDTGNKHK